MSDLGTPALLAIFIGAALEGLLVIAVVCVTVMSAVLPSSASIGPVGVGGDRDRGDLGHWDHDGEPDPGPRRPHAGRGRHRG
jgi:hypothetical protein